MTGNLPNYSALEPPAETPPSEYSTHERRAEILQLLIEVGTPGAIKQRRLAERYDVHESTISRDMDRLRESVDEHLGDDAKLTTRVIFESVIEDLLGAEDWRAKKAALDAVMDWNQWLADLGEQHREPQRSEVDVEARSANIAYRVVREGDGEPLPTTEDGDGVDYDALGFTAGPAAVDVEAVEDSSDAADGEGADGE